MKGTLIEGLLYIGKVPRRKKYALAILDKGSLEVLGYFRTQKEVETFRKALYYMLGWTTSP